MRKKEIEILAPAGSWDSLMAGISAGADAVYIGGSRFGARAYADNLDEEQMMRAIDYVHLHGRKIYMTVNTLLKEKELSELYDYLCPYYRQGLDAVIVQDMGVMRYIREVFPELAIHVSTQATVTNTHGAEFFRELGAVRIVPARELSLAEIREMKERTGLEIECFVHGALCYCYSGQCLLSSMIGGRSGNRGQCAQPCRLPYRVSGKGPAADVMSLKDLCTIDLIPELVDAGIDSFKIEGRMKQPDYVYTVTGMYRKYTDLYLEHGKEGYQVSEEDRRKLTDSYRRRGYCEGYYKRQNGREMISLKRPDAEREVLKESVDYKIQEKINGKLRLSEGECAKLSLGLQRGADIISAEVYGDVVQTAMKQPLEIERIEKQMRKTGNTEFVFDVIETELRGSVFLTMQSLNELRREGIAQLEQAIQEHYRREISDVRVQEEVRFCLYENREVSSVRLEVSVQTVEQLKKVMECPDVRVLYVDGNIGFDRDVTELVQEGHKRRNLKIYLAMPHIFRKRALSCYERDYEKLEQYYDGVLIRGWEEYHWLTTRGYGGRIISDSNMYVFNTWSKQFIAQSGIDEYTSSVELNNRELRELGFGGILTVYGYQPVMVTANCIHKTCGKCTGKEEVLYLTDRYKKRFAVKNYCKYCYNIIYNSSPLVLLDQTEEISGLCPSGIRLDFTLEKDSEVAFVIELYRRAFLEGEHVALPDMDYTRGHFKRGVK